MALELIVRWEDGEDSSLDAGELLIAALEEIDTLAEERSLRGLSTYADDREIPADFDGDPQELAELLGPNPVWHTPAEASENFRSLALAADGGDDSDIADGLRELASTLRGQRRAFQLDVIV